MIYLKHILLLTFIIVTSSLSAQEHMYMAPKVQKAFENGTRSHDGQAGDNYWANKPSYQLDINFNPLNSLLDGKGTITYKNNSPDTLHRLTFALLGNIYKENIVRDWSMRSDLAHDGTVVTAIEVDGRKIDVESEKVKVGGTNMYVTLDKPILPNGTAEIKIEWHLLFPKGANIRSGNYGDSTYFISYFYPKVAVYDDIDGWDNANYTGYTEFYGEYSDFEVNVTLPGDFFLWSTGELQNPKDVYTSTVLDRWEAAKKSDEVIHVITKDEIGTKEIVKSMQPMVWKHKAKNVTDFAFGFSNAFQWDSRSVLVDRKAGRRTIVNAAYNPKSEDYVEVAQIAAEALHNYSTSIPGIPYPYPVMSVFNGNSGMEFPMMCNDASQKTKVGTAGLTYHEIAHTYFPFFIGTNERKYAWMDEGWASFFPSLYFDSYGSSFEAYFVKRRQLYESFAGDEGEAPIIMSSKAINGRSSYRQASYNKSFLAYYYLMDYLGTSQFTIALQGYMNEWKGKHPIPYDFFNSMSTHAKKDLNWFWNSWFMEKNHADLALGEITKNKIEVLNPGRLFLPIYVEVTYEDGEINVLERKLSIWRSNPNKYTFRMEGRNSKIKSVRLGHWNIADVNLDNNYVLMR